MQFASCQWDPYAKSFLQKIYPSQVIDETKIPKLLDLLKEDILRIQDPDMHQPCQIVAGPHYNDSLKQRVAEALEEFKVEVHNKPIGKG